MEDKIDIGFEIREFLKAHFGTLKKSAKLLHISEQRLSSYVNNKRKMPMNIQEKLISMGFNREYFAVYYDIGVKKSYQDFDEFRYVVYQLNKIIYQKELIIFSLNNDLKAQAELINQLRNQLKINNSVDKRE